MDQTFWMAGVSSDPTDPFSSELFCHVNRNVVFAWLIGTLSEYEEAEPYIADVTRALNTSDQGIVVGIPDHGLEEVRGFAMPMTLYGNATAASAHGAVMNPDLDPSLIHHESFVHSKDITCPRCTSVGTPSGA